ncbi:basic helix-loop-helix protein [Allomyces arbusculus]|nr:basic helix-loop-helix protein [Allomyces arbusculus]
MASSAPVPALAAADEPAVAVSAPAEAPTSDLAGLLLASNPLESNAAAATAATASPALDTAPQAPVDEQAVAAAAAAAVAAAQAQEQQDHQAVQSVDQVQPQVQLDPTQQQQLDAAAAAAAAAAHVGLPLGVAPALTPSVADALRLSGVPTDLDANSPLGLAVLAARNAAFQHQQQQQAEAAAAAAAAMATSMSSSPAPAGSAAAAAAAAAKLTPGTDEWLKQRRESHKEVERRRREVINTGIAELAKIVPNCSDRNKGGILHRAVQYIQQLKEAEQRNAERWTLDKMLADQAINDLTGYVEFLKAENDAMRGQITQLGGEAPPRTAPPAPSVPPYHAHAAMAAMHPGYHYFAPPPGHWPQAGYPLQHPGATPATTAEGQPAQPAQAQQQQQQAMLDMQAAAAAQMHQAFAEQQMQFAQMHQQQLAEQQAAAAAAAAAAVQAQAHAEAHAQALAPAEKRAHPDDGEEGVDEASKRARIEEVANNGDAVLAAAAAAAMVDDAAGTSAVATPGEPAGADAQEVSAA